MAKTPTIISSIESTPVASGTAISVSTPPTYTGGDWVVFYIGGQTAGGGSDFTGTSYPRISAPFVASQQDGRMLGIYGRRINAGETLPSTVSFSMLTNPNAGRIVAYTQIIRNIDPTTPIAGYSTPYAGVVSNVAGSGFYGTRVQPIAVDQANSLMVVVGRNEFTSGQTTTPVNSPSGLTLAANVASSPTTTVSRTLMWIWTGLVGAGNTPIQPVSWPTYAGGAAQAVVFRGAPDDAAPTKNNRWVFGDMMALAPSYRSYTIAQAATAAPFYMSHRGGSANYPEGTLKAYTNSVFLGARCLEIPVQRSADGVFIVSHDATLLRVTGQNLTISATNATAMLGLPITVPRSGGVICRLEDVVSKYKDLVLAVDEKQYNYGTELLDLLETFYPTREIAKQHIIVKQDGSGGSWSLTTAKARGYTTWGTFFDDAIGNQANAQSYDWVGVQYSASDALWAQARTYNRPLVGFQLQDAQGSAAVAAAARSVAQGAMGLQIADVKAVIPRQNNVP